jgi:hypothetical protein
MGKNFKLTQKEVALALFIAILGFAFSSREWVLFLNTLNPLEGLIIYYIILYSCLTLLSYFGLVIFNIKIKNPIQTFGLILITFAFFITVDWESPYIQLLTKGNVEDASTIFYQSEDGATWYFWYDVMKIKDVETCRILTFVFTPLLLCLIGGYLVTQVELGGW